MDKMWLFGTKSRSPEVKYWMLITQTEKILLAWEETALVKLVMICYDPRGQGLIDTFGEEGMELQCKLPNANLDAMCTISFQ